MSDVVLRNTLEERVAKKLRESIGELITEADLGSIVKRGIDEVFFTERTVEVNRYGQPSKKIPPLIHQLILESINDKLVEIIDVWVKDHETEVTAIIENTVSDGVALSILRRFNHLFNSDVQTYRDQNLERLFGVN